MSDNDDFGWHALNYRTAHTVHAQAMWVELEACLQRKIAAAVATERERCAKVCEEWASVRSPEHGGLALLNVAERIRAIRKGESQ